MINKLTFSEYVIRERGENFYYISLKDIIRCKSTPEKWWRELHLEWNIKYNNKFIE